MYVWIYMYEYIYMEGRCSNDNQRKKDYQAECWGNVDIWGKVVGTS